MFNKLMIWVLSIRMNRILNKITAYKAIPHTSGYSKTEGDRRITLLREKYNKIADKRAVRLFLDKVPKSKARVRANMLTAGICLWALVIIVLMAFAGKVCAVEHKTPTVAEEVAETQGITTFIDTEFNNVCYVIHGRGISCVPIKE